jgi:hypothetical protein
MKDEGENFFEELISEKSEKEILDLVSKDLSEEEILEKLLNK